MAAYEELFDAALALRDAGQLEEALAGLESLLAQLPASENKRAAHTHLQIGNISDRLERPAHAQRAFQNAVALDPRMELASIALFFALERMNRHDRALEEAVRFLSLCDSVAYREYCEESGFELRPPEHAALAARATELIDEHRARARNRTALAPGDVVRISRRAAAWLHPGHLAFVRALDGDTVEVQIGSGERFTLERSFLDDD